MLLTQSCVGLKIFCTVFEILLNFHTTVETNNSYSLFSLTQSSRTWKSYWRTSGREYECPCPYSRSRKKRNTCCRYVNEKSDRQCLVLVLWQGEVCEGVLAISVFIFVRSVLFYVCCQTLCIFRLNWNVYMCSCHNSEK